MGITYAEITLANTMDEGLARHGHLAEQDVKKTTIRMMVDTGAFMLGINEKIQKDLRLDVIGTSDAVLADNSVISCDVVGPVSVYFQNRSTICRAIVLPGESDPLLGAIPLEDMDVLIDLRKNELIVNPEHPFRAMTILK